MPFRKYTATPLDLHFRDDLHSWTRKLVCSHVAVNRVVQRTIDVLCNNPERWRPNRFHRRRVGVTRRIHEKI